MRALVLAVVVVCMATVAAAIQLPPRARAQPNTADCALPDGWAEIEERGPEFVIFGEFHGTWESPAFVGQVACALALSGKQVLLAVEFPATNDKAFQTAWALPHAEFANALGSAGWSGRQDGVASEAMFGMLVRLHALKATGADIRIVAFNGAKDDRQRDKFAHLPGQGPHEAAQAENIANAFRAADFDIALVLVGESHARKRAIDLAGANYEPMAMRLANAGAIVSLRMRAAGGTAWSCLLKPGYKPEPGKLVTSDAVDCADHPISSDGDLRRLPFVSLSAFPNGEGNDNYDGYYWVGALSSSRPAFPGRL